MTWVNNDTVPHTATSDTGVWDSGTLNPGQSFSFTFNDAGTFPYHCAIHGAASMSGTIVVENASPTPSASPTEPPPLTPVVTPTELPTGLPTALPTEATGQAGQAGQAGQQGTTPTQGQQ